MKFKKEFFFGVALGVFSLTTGAMAETLENALIKAYLNNPELNAQRASLRATDEAVSQALSNWRPNVTWTGTADRQQRDDNTRTTSSRTVSTNPLTSTFTITQPLFRGFQTVNETAEAEANVKAERWRLVDQEQETLLDAVTAYANMLRDAAVLQLNTNNEQVLLRQLEATQDRFDVGELTRTDVSQAQSRYSRSVADRIQSQGDLEQARADYENVIGDIPVDLEIPAAISSLPPTVDEAVALAMKNNPAFLAAFYDEVEAMEDIDKTAGRLLPELDLVASSSTSLYTSTDDNRTDTHKIGLSLTIPFYQQGSVYSEVREAKQTAAQRRMEMEQARRNAIEVAKTSWEELVTARARIESFQDEIRSAEVALDGVQREAAVGSRTVLDVLDAEQELLDAKVSLVRVQRDELVAMFELKQAIGELTAEKLGLDTGIYEPDVHYNEVRGKWIGTSSVGDIDEMVDVDNN